MTVVVVVVGAFWEDKNFVSHVFNWNFLDLLVVSLVVVSGGVGGASTSGVVVSKKNFCE